MIRKHLKLSWLYAQLVLLSACNEESLLSGIEGSGIPSSPAAITTFGQVTELGSIVVNDVEYDLTDALITINGASARESDLALGHVVVVEGELSAGSGHGAATRAAVEIPVAGRVATTDTSLNRFMILGQTIAINANTIIVDSVEDGLLGGLAVGQDVQVSGFVDSAGVLHATRIEPRKVTTPLLVTGHVADVDRNTQTFSINGQLVDYGSATLRGFPSPIQGARVRVAIRGLQQDTVIADEVDLLDSRLPGEFGDAATVEGLVTRFGSQDSFDVNGYPVVREESESETIDFGLDSLVRVDGMLVADAVVRATAIKNLAVPPGRVAGRVTIDEVGWGLSGILTPEGNFRLNLEELSAGSPVSGPGLGQLVGSFIPSSYPIVGDGVLIGEACALPSASRFCGTETRVQIELRSASGLETDQWGRSIGVGATGMILVDTESGEESWPLDFGYAGSVAGFDPGGPESLERLAALYLLGQAEFVQNSRVIMSVERDGSLFFQSAETGCIGNGVISSHLDQPINLYDIELKLEACAGPYVYLNSDYEGLATQESQTVWSYDLSILSIWVSTVSGATAPAAITLWGQDLDYLESVTNGRQ